MPGDKALFLDGLELPVVFVIKVLQLRDKVAAVRFVKVFIGRVCLDKPVLNVFCFKFRAL
jgi:hypothetical protein